MWAKGVRGGPDPPVVILILEGVLEGLAEFSQSVSHY